MCRRSDFQNFGKCQKFEISQNLGIVESRFPDFSGLGISRKFWKSGFSRKFWKIPKNWDFPGFIDFSINSGKTPKSAKNWVSGPPPEIGVLGGQFWTPKLGGVLRGAFSGEFITRKPAMSYLFSIDRTFNQSLIRRHPKQGFPGPPPNPGFRGFPGPPPNPGFRGFPGPPQMGDLGKSGFNRIINNLS